MRMVWHDFSRVAQKAVPDKEKDGVALLGQRRNNGSVAQIPTIGINAQCTRKVLIKHIQYEHIIYEKSIDKAHSI